MFNSNSFHDQYYNLKFCNNNNVSSIQKAARANKVELHFRDLGDQMITEETALMDKLKQNIKEKSERIQNLTKALSFPKFELHKKAGDGLMQVDAALK